MNYHLCWTWNRKELCLQKLRAHTLHMWWDSITIINTNIDGIFLWMFNFGCRVMHNSSAALRTKRTGKIMDQKLQLLTFVSLVCKIHPIVSLSSTYNAEILVFIKLLSGMARGSLPIYGLGLKCESCVLENMQQHYYFRLRLSWCPLHTRLSQTCPFLIIFYTGRYASGCV